jgi:hypothetical protein
MEWLNDKIQHAGAVVVYFTAFQPPHVITPPESAFEAELGLRRLSTTPDGYLLGKP